MNRSLLTGCALFALAVGCGSTAAQAAGFELKLGGDAYFEAGYVDQDNDAGLRSTEFRNRFRVVVTPTAKADNGMEYGARLRLRARAATGQADADRAYIFANGVFGTVQAGSLNGLSDEYGVIAPVGSWGTEGGPDGDYLFFIPNVTIPYDGGSLRTLGSADIGTRIVYLTPKFNGFQLGATYQPETGSINTAIDRSENGRVAATAASLALNGFSDYEFSDVYEVGAFYEGSFSGVDLKGSAVYSGGEAKPFAGLSREDLSSWMVGAQIGYNGFSFGGSYASAGESGYNVGDAFKDDQRVWTLGAAYTMGPWVFGASYGNFRDAGDATVAGDNQMDLYSAAVTYQVAPGLTTALEYNYFDQNGDATTGSDNGSVVILFGKVAF